MGKPRIETASERRAAREAARARLFSTAEQTDREEKKPQPQVLASAQEDIVFKLDVDAVAMIF